MSRSSRTKWAVGAALGCAALMVGATHAQESPLAAAGAEYYQQYCASCHGVGGKGDGPAAVALRMAPADLTTITQRRGEPFPALYVAQHIDGTKRVSAHGTTDMPVWGRRFRRDVSGPGASGPALRGRVLLLVEYIRSIQAR